MFVDSHCHLVFPELRAQLDSIRTAMAQAQVDRALCICTTLEEFADVHALATGYDNFWATVGVHPDNEDVQEPTLADLLERGALPRVVGIGRRPLRSVVGQSTCATVIDTRISAITAKNTAVGVVQAIHSRSIPNPPQTRPRAKPLAM
mgnify:CR=1 FL=1